MSYTVSLGKLRQRTWKISLQAAIIKVLNVEAERGVQVKGAGTINDSIMKARARGLCNEDSYEPHLAVQIKTACRAAVTGPAGALCGQ